MEVRQPKAKAPSRTDERKSRGCCQVQRAERLLTGVACRPEYAAGSRLRKSRRTGDGSRTREWKEPTAQAKGQPEKSVADRMQGAQANCRTDERKSRGCCQIQSKPKGADRGSVQTRARRRVSPEESETDRRRVQETRVEMADRESGEPPESSVRGCKARRIVQAAPRSERIGGAVRP